MVNSVFGNFFISEKTSMKKTIFSKLLKDRYVFLGGSDRYVLLGYYFWPVLKYLGTFFKKYSFDTSDLIRQTPIENYVEL